MAASAAPIVVTQVTTAIEESAAHDKVVETTNIMTTVAKKLPAKASAVVTKVASVALKAADAMSTTHAIITTYDDRGNVTEKREVHSDSFMDVINKILENFAKLIALGTSALGLYVGWQKLRSPTKLE